MYIPLVAVRCFVEYIRRILGEIKKNAEIKHEIKLVRVAMNDHT